jgi:hypothetical protein
MAYAHRDRVGKQLRALAEIFVEGLSPAEVVDILQTGPCRLFRACRVFAWGAVRFVEGLELGDPTRIESRKVWVPILDRLRGLAAQGFLDRFGSPRQPRLPKRLPDLEIGVCTSLDAEDHRPLDRHAMLLCRTLVDGHCTSWSSRFFLTRTRDLRAFRLWLEWEDDESREMLTTQAAWMAAGRDARARDAALLLLDAYWSALLETWEHGRPDELEACGSTITQDDLEVLALRVWGPAPG